MTEDQLLEAYTNPGPIDDSVLYEQDQHVSAAVWNGKERGALICNEHTSNLDDWNLTKVQIELVESAGFYYLSRFISGISLDIPLISAMVERWRRETNTFHLNVGEMTVTLKDVALLLGLPIDGDPVNIVLHTSNFLVCEKFLGEIPPYLHDTSGMVILSWLKKRFSHCPKDATYEVIKYHTRAYLLYLVGNTIFSSTTEDRVPVMYLPLFEDFHRRGNYAWGAAALAFLYRELGNASLRSQTKISGCLTLLQCWCYFYLKIGRRKIYRNPVPDHFPFVRFWKGRQSGTTKNRDVVFYRKILDSMTECDVEWQPYRRVIESVIPKHIMITAMNVGKSKIMLIFFEKAERHLPDRCLRQLGLTRSIPKDVERWVRKSLPTPNLLENMESEINEWFKDRRIVKQKDDADESAYMQWYLKITRKFVGRHIIPVSLSSDFQRQNAGLRGIAVIVDAFSTEGLDLEQVEWITLIKRTVKFCLRDLTGGSSMTDEEGNTELSDAVVKFDETQLFNAKKTMNNSQLCDEPKVVINPVICDAAVNLGETQYFEPYDTLSQLCDEPEVVTSSAIYNADEKVDDSHVCAATPKATDFHLSTESKKGNDSEFPALNTESDQQKAIGCSFQSLLLRCCKRD